MPQRSAVTRPASTANVRTPRIDRDRVEPRQILRPEREQHLHTRRASATPPSVPTAAITRLSEHLPHQLHPPGADGRAHRELADCARGAHDEQVGHIRAGDEEDERDGAHQRENRRPDIADQILEHRHRVKYKPDVCLIGNCCAQVGRDAVDERLRLLHAHAWFQAPDHAERDVVAIRGLEVEARGRPHVRSAVRRSRAAETAPRNPARGRPRCAQRPPPSRHPCRSRSGRRRSAHPERVADDRDGGQSRRSGRVRRRWSLFGGCGCGTASSSMKSRPSWTRAPSTRKKFGVAPPDADLLGSAPVLRDRRATPRNEPAMSSKSSVDCWRRSR
jgi:hypothetical protein